MGTAPRLQSGPFLSLSSEMLAQRVQVRSPASPPCFQQGAAEAAAGSWLGNCQAGGWRAAMQIPSPQAVRPTPGSPRTSTARQNPRALRGSRQRPPVQRGGVQVGHLEAPAPRDYGPPTM